MDRATLVIRCFDRFDELAELWPSDGRLVRVPRDESNTDASQREQGEFGRLDKHLVILYRWNGRLYLRIDSGNHELTNDTRAELVRGSVNTLTILQRGYPVCTVAYEPPEPEPPLSEDPTPFVEEEHFDLGVFIYNVVNDPRRRDAIYQ